MPIEVKQRPGRSIAQSSNYIDAGVLRGVFRPAIASRVKQAAADFYWHLGDFRAIYMFDEDMVPPPQLGLQTRPINVITYLTTAWPDFIAHQLNPFGVPIFLAIGNHETIPPAT